MNNFKNISLGLIALTGVTTTFAASAFGGGNFSERSERGGYHLESGEDHTIGNRGRRGGHGFMKNQDIDHSIVKLSNGIETTMTTSDADILEKLHSRLDRQHPERENVSHDVVKLSNGLKVTVTTTDSEILEKLHNKADRKSLKDATTRTITNLDNGVVISITSDNAEAVTKIQERAEKMAERTPKHDDVTKTIETISNGIKITITTTDADKVEKIQQRAENPKGKKGGKRGGRGQR